MSEIFSIATGSVAIVSVCVKLASDIRQLRKDMGGVEEELATLERDIDGLLGLCRTVTEAYDRKSTIAIPESAEQTLVIEKLWADLGKVLDDCRAVLEKLDNIFQKIRGQPSNSAFRKFDMVMRKRQREGDLSGCKIQLESYQQNLQIRLTLIARYETGISQSYNAEMCENLESQGQKISSQIADLQQSIKSKDDHHYNSEVLTALRDLQESVNFAAMTLKSGSANHHFDVPYPVSSIFTGREILLQELRQIFIPKHGIIREQFQRRFVIQGLGGSGKTQFCCKFAQDNRDSFWGIFWIDASTTERISESLSAIAKIAGLNGERSALYWLSNLEQTWLLIIDNADGENIPLDNYFPKGNRGNILVTTINPAYTIHGNVGPRYYKFSGLKVEEATQLLLKASNAPPPWDASCKELALNITNALGSLALAIILAGAAIRDGLCSLRDYLEHYSRSWRRIRSAKLSTEGLDSDIKIYATWEILYSQLEQKGTEASLDALELLNILAFLHWEAIPREIFSRAIRNPEKEVSQATDPASQLSAPRAWSTVCIDWLRELPGGLLALLIRDSGRAILPSFMRNAQKRRGVDDADDRVRYALKELVNVSLIIRNDHSDTYAMHPIVHTWARERPKMRLAEQALWADVTGRVLAASILLPPLGLSSTDEKYHVSLLPHVEHVQACRRSTADAMYAERHSSSFSFVSSWITTLLPILTPDADKIRMYAKFSLIYAKCGNWKSAEELLNEVTSFLCRYLGPRHQRSRQARLFLSSVYWELGRPVDAAELQTLVLQTCVASFGPTHPDTLKAMGQLGRTRWQQGQYTVARGLQEPVLRELQQSNNSSRADILEAMDSLALTVLKFWKKCDFEEAARLHLEAASGMAAEHGPDHERTLIAKENYCRAVVLLGGEHLDSTPDIMNEVLEARRAKLGKEHPYTLLAMVNMAIVLTAVGQFDKAEDFVRRGLPVAERTLGTDHIGTLFGQSVLACILVQRRQYTAAEEILVEVSEKQKHMASHRGDYHPDRLATLIELARCSFALGKIDRAIIFCDEAICGFDTISTDAHPLCISLQDARARMMQLRSSGVVDYLSEQHRDDYEFLFPFTLFKPSSYE